VTHLTKAHHTPNLASIDAVFGSPDLLASALRLT
jgi:hypothetical protein